MNTAYQENLVSVIMPAYNSQDTICASIEGVSNQTYQNIELIVVNDGSSDGTSSIAKEKLSKIGIPSYLLNFSKNSGVAMARNFGLHQAKGQYIAFCDSDDLWAPKKIEMQVHAMQKHNKFCSHGFYNRITENYEHKRLVRSPKVVTKSMMKWQNHIGNLTGIYDRSSLGLFFQDTDKKHEDFDMWLRVLEETDSIGVQEVIASYMVRSGSISSNKFKSATWHFKVVERNFGFMTAVYSFPIYVIRALLRRASQF